MKSKKEHYEQVEDVGLQSDNAGGFDIKNVASPSACRVLGFDLNSVIQQSTVLKFA